MYEHLAHAPTAELWQLVHMMPLSADPSKELSVYLSEIMDELKRRGELGAASEEEMRACFEGALAKAAELQRMEKLKAARQRLISDIQENRTQKNRRLARLWKIGVAATAAVAIFAISGTIATSAGFDFWGSISRWTSDAWHTITGQAHVEDTMMESDQNFTPLWDKLDELDIPVALPSVVPKGFKFDSFGDASAEPPKRMLAWFGNGTQAFSLGIKQVDAENYTSSHEINPEEGVTDELIGGVHYAVMENNGRMRAVWFDGEYELSLQGELSQEQLVAMLESIEK